MRAKRQISEITHAADDVAGDDPAPSEEYSPLERQVQADILLALGSRPDLRMFRRNVGAARTESGRLVRFNLKGMADLWGITAPEGWHVELEVKTETGRLSKAQRAWRAFCEGWCIYVLARSVDEAVQQLDAALAARRARGPR